MRNRQRILDNLERLYRDELDRAAPTEGSDDGRLDFEFQRDQLYLEVLLDLRDLFGGSPEAEQSTSSLLEKAQKLRDLTRLR
ncbi:MAG TPA: hypothetical protein EYQ64_15790 [Gemmatimonadetes bacterium]|jgi:hypothetical protein|nr:hypothetical protein [Gemmatimonadota bacterium]